MILNIEYIVKTCYRNVMDKVVVSHQFVANMYYFVMERLITFKGNIQHFQKEINFNMKDFYIYIYIKNDIFQLLRKKNINVFSCSVCVCVCGWVEIK